MAAIIAASTITTMEKISATVIISLYSDPESLVNCSWKHWVVDSDWWGLVVLAIRTLPSWDYQDWPLVVEIMIIVDASEGKLQLFGEGLLQESSEKALEFS